MPWTCEACGVEAERDEAECPSCAAPKTSWTMVRDETRSFVLTVKRFELLRGADKAPASVAPVMAKDAARGASPLDPEALLHVRLFARGTKDPSVSLALEFEQAEVTPAGFPAFEPVNAEGFVDVPFLLVHGPGNADGIDLDGVHVVDATEETELGFAPAVEVEALGKPPRTLPTEAFTGWYLSARFFDRTGQRSAADLALTVAGREARTDMEGRVVVEQVPPAQLEVTFGDRSVIVPAVHDPRVVVGVWLRFVEPGELPVAALDVPLEEDAGLHPASELVGADEAEAEATEGAMGACSGGRHGGGLLSARFVDRLGWSPVADATFTVGDITAQTDADGFALVGGLPLDLLTVTFEGGEARVPAVDDERRAVLVRLRFVDPPAERPDAPVSAEEVADEAADEDEQEADLDVYPAGERAEDEEGAPVEDDDPPAFGHDAGPAPALLSVRFLDRTGRFPVADEPFRADGREGRTDATGLALLRDVEGLEATVELAGHAVRVPTVRDERIVVLARLREREATEAEQARPVELEEEGAIETHPAGERGPDEGEADLLVPEEAPEMHGSQA